MIEQNRLLKIANMFPYNIRCRPTLITIISVQKMPNVSFSSDCKTNIQSHVKIMPKKNYQKQKRQEHFVVLNQKSIINTGYDK